MARFFDSHMHTPLCKHAVGDPRDYARQGMQRGLAGCIFTCHSPMPNGFSASVRMMPEQFEEYVTLIRETAAELEGVFEIRLGMESDYFPGMEPWLDELHQRAEFHYILGSVHYQIAEYHDRFFTGDVHSFQDRYFEHLADSAETKLFDALAHPDLVKNASPDEWSIDRAMPAIERSLDRIAEAGVAMELNTSGLNKSLPEMNPGFEMLRSMRDRDIPVVLGSDAHLPERVGADFEHALGVLTEAGYSEVCVFENREPYFIEIPGVLRELRNTGMSSPLLSKPCLPLL